MNKFQGNYYVHFNDKNKKKSITLNADEFKKLIAKNNVFIKHLEKKTKHNKEPEKSLSSSSEEENMTTSEDSD